MELLSIPSQSTSSSSTKVLTLDGTTAKFRTAEQIRIDGGGAAAIHAPTHGERGSDPLEISQKQVFDSLLQEDGSFLLTEGLAKLSIQGVDDIRDIITQLRTVSASDAILGRKSPGSGFFEELTISDALDFIGATARGDIVYRGADGWDRLPAGSNGQFLRTQGTTGDPTWATVTGSVSDGDKGDITVSNSGNTWTIDAGVVNTTKLGGDITAAGKALLDDATAADQRTTLQLGSLATLSSVNLTTNVTNILPLANGGTGSATGISYSNVTGITPSRILGRKSGTTGVAEECTLSEVLDFVGSAAHGDILYRGSTGWVRLGAGTNGQYLKTQGSGANPVWAAVSTNASRAVLQFSDPGQAMQFGIRSGAPIDAWPFIGVGISPDSGIYTAHRITFNPTSYQLSVVMRETIEVSSSVQSIPNPVGLTLQVKTNTTGWTDVTNWDLRGVSGFAHTSGSLSLGSPTEVFFRIVSYNQSNADRNFNQLNLVLTVWN